MGTGGTDWKMAAICCIFNGWKQQYMLCTYGNTARHAQKQNHKWIVAYQRGLICPSLSAGV